MGEIGLEQLFNRFGRILGFDVAINFSAQIGVGAEAATCEQVIAFHALVVVANRDSGGDQPDIADVVLRAGMMASRYMDVERSIDRNSRLAPVADLGSMTFGVRRRKFAAGIPGAGNQSSADLRGLDREPYRLDRRDRYPNVFVRHT